MSSGDCDINCVQDCVCKSECTNAETAINDLSVSAEVDVCVKPTIAFKAPCNVNCTGKGEIDCNKTAGGKCGCICCVKGTACVTVKNVVVCGRVCLDLNEKLTVAAPVNMGPVTCNPSPQQAQQ